MTNAIRTSFTIIITIIAFAYGMSILLTKKINDLNYIDSGIELYYLTGVESQITKTAWYNILLSGQNIIRKENETYIVINSEQGLTVAALSSDIILSTLLAPINIIIL